MAAIRASRPAPVPVKARAWSGEALGVAATARGADEADAADAADETDPADAGLRDADTRLATEGDAAVSVNEDTGTHSPFTTAPALPPLVVQLVSGEVEPLLVVV